MGKLKSYFSVMSSYYLTDRRAFFDTVWGNTTQSFRNSEESFGQLAGWRVVSATVGVSLSATLVYMLANTVVLPSPGTL